MTMGNYGFGMDVLGLLGLVLLVGLIVLTWTCDPAAAAAAPRA
jgi:hypothetical protein